MEVHSSNVKAKAEVVAKDDIEEVRASKVSQMPTGLINTMNPQELRDLVAYIMSGGNPGHKIFGKK